ncbi:MAG: extracellular solute-binding protein [Chloroflexota bacterium]|nr:MAG: extracellular solute-binding protein [Chloroflexota bacterium]
MLAAVALVAAACGTGASPKPSLDMPSSIGEAEDELNLIIWAGYAERGEVDPAYDWVTPFETETGCKVNTTDMGSSAEGVQLMESGQYDGGSFSGNATDRLMASGTVAPVNVSLLSNYANVFEGLKNKAHNSKDGVAYGVPHGRGPNLLAYNTEVVTEAPTSWDPIWEGGSEYAGKISIYGYSDFIADAAIHLMETTPDLKITNPYQLNQAQFDAAVALLEAQRDNGAVYWASYSDQVSGFAAGDLVIGTTWQFQVNLLQAEGEPVEAVLPDEGSTGWSDTWMIHKDAAHPNCMYLWMNHMMSAEANGQATVWFGEAPTSPQACTYAETLSPGHCDLTHATDEAYYSKIWYWATPRADCADTDAATTCKDQAAWTEAWTSLTGS